MPLSTHPAPLIRAPRRRFLGLLAFFILLLAVVAFYRGPWAVAPSVPANVSPADGATGVPANPQLCATVADPDGGTIDVTFYGREGGGGPAADFTLIALPDTQYYSRDFPATFSAQTDWIADNRDTRNIVFVSQLGDCTEDGDAAPAQWTVADGAFSLLETALGPGYPDGVPYGIAVGNHDQTPHGSARSGGDEGATTLLYNQTFGTGRFQGRAYYGGHYGGNNDNHFELFSASGMDFLALHLEFDPAASAARTAVLDWADAVLKSHPGRRALLTSHYLLNPDGTFGNQGLATWDALKDNPNLFLMLCGHLDQAARRTDTSGTTVTHTLLSDYQTQPNGGNGWLRILTFSPANDTLSVQTYSPTLDQSLTNASNQFTLPYDMAGGPPFRVLGAVADVASGGTACVSWPGRAAGTAYEWYAAASDGTDVTEGARWSFTSDGSCLTPADCDDGDACTGDDCVGGFCAHAPDPSCCNLDGECDDGAACTADACDAGNPAALSFDGGDFVTMGAAPGLNGATFTLEAWVLWNGGGTSANTGTGGFDAYPIITKGRGEAEGTNVDTNYFFGVRSTDGRLAADFEEGAGVCAGGTTPGAACGRICSNSASGCSLDSQCGGGTCTSSTCGGGGVCSGAPGLNHPVVGTTVLPVGSWHHVAVTYDGSCWEIYLDGQPDTPGTTCPGVAPRADSIQHFALGTAMNSTGAAVGGWSGLIDEARVTRRALGAAEIQARMDTLRVSDPDLAGHWHLDEAAGTTARDATSPAEDGTLSGATWITTGLQDVGTHACLHAPIAGCCETGADCDDGNACTADSCASGVCVFDYAPSPGCCSAPADCEDGNPCTGDFCDVPTGTCSNTGNGDCCLSNPDCDDDNDCTVDVCSVPDTAALRFNGSTGQVSMGPAPELGLAAFTLETWFRWNGGGATASTGTGGITAYPLVTKGRGEADDDERDMNYFLGIRSSDGRLAADFEEGVGGGDLGLNHPVIGTTAVTTGVWHHAAVTYDGECWQLYLDGQSDTAGTTCPSQPPRADSIQHFALATALDSNGAAQGRFAGDLDEVRLWDHARTGWQIQSGMNASITAAPGLVARWGLDEGTGTTVNNSAGDPSPGTLAGGVTWITTDLPPLAASACRQIAIPGCCTTTSECDDGDPCTADACTGNSCTHDPIAGCCETAADCDDGDVCTADTCAGNTCVFEPGLCCATAADCDDGNVCTSDACVPGNAASLSFDGTNDYVTMGMAPGLGASQFTLEGWIKITGAGATVSTGTGGLAAAVPLVTKGRGEGDNSNLDMNYFFGLSGGKLAADYEEAAGTPNPGLNHPVTAATTVTTGVWHHAAVTYDGACWKIYLDGASDLPVANCPNRPPRADSIQHFGLGTAMTSTGLAAGFFRGLLDEVRVWNVARTQAEIQTDMHLRVTTHPNLLGRWGLDEGVGTVAQDSALPAQNGTLTNAPTWSTVDLAPVGPNLCSSTPVTNGTPCSDGDACTAGDSCQAGSCVAGGPASCDDGDACTTDSCDPVAGCVSAPIDCNDGNACTTDACDPIQGCVYSTVTCDDGNACTTDSCDPVAGCVSAPIDCNDGNACTTDACDPIQGCVYSTVACDDGDACTTDSCDPVAGCVSAPIDCNDGNACTTDACDPGTGCVTAPVDCNDGLACTSDSCDPATGCVYVAVGCDDGNACTTDTCDPATGCVYSPVGCDDGNACTTDTCDPATGCVYSPVTCDDGDACTTDTCDPVAGCVTAPIDCNDGNACTTDACDPIQGCVYSTVACDDGDACTSDTCDPVAGCVTAPIDCNDGNACTTDACDPASGCVYSPATCDDGNACTTDSCDPVAGCVFAPNSDPCDDGDACTTGDVCTNGTCAGSAPPEVCNNADDDCDGRIDEDDPGGGAACGTGQSGVCAAGTIHCVTGVLSCVADAAPATDTVLVEFGTGMKYRANTTASVVEDAVLIQFGSPMKYLPNSTDPGIGLAWTATVFDDGAWGNGEYGVGYETAPPGATALIRTSVASGVFSVFTRTTFEIADRSRVRSLLFGADYDDGYVVWLNGVELSRSSTMPAGDPVWNTNTGLHESSNGSAPAYGTLIDITGPGLPALENGTNVLAIGVWNSGAPTSTDLVVVPRLSIGFDWTSPAYDDATWSDGEYGVGYETRTSGARATALLRTIVPAGTFSVFTRARFDVANPAAVASLFLGADYDDGFVAWINGVEVFGSAELPMGPLTPTTNAALHESSNGATPGYGTLIDISTRGIPALLPGENVLAVGVWNSNAAASTDLVLVPRLSIGEADVCDGLDNDCDGLVDEGHRDGDSDGLADCVDPDDDNDGTADADDCAPIDPGASAPPPAEVDAFLWQRGPYRVPLLTWTSQGGGVVYDLAGGRLSDLSADDGAGGALCVAGGNDLPMTMFDDTRPDPPIGDGYYYVIRAQTASCGAGTYGFASDGMERLPAAACP
jgi:hypothetical protein